MGLRQLEWHELRGNGWVARIKYSNDKYRRFAEVNIVPHYVNHVPKKVLIHMMYGPTAFTWHDSIDAAKLHVEALFALED